MKRMKLVFGVLSIWAAVSSLTACSADGAGPSPAATGTTTPNTTQPSVNEIVPAGKVEVDIWDTNGSLLYSDKYANTKNAQTFNCFYDKRGTLNALLLTGYNPSSGVSDIKRFFVTVAGNFILKEGANDLRTTAGNSLITVDGKAAPADKPVYDQGFRYKAAMNGCRVSLLKEGDDVKGQLNCDNISDSAFEDGFEMRVSFNCTLATLK